MSTTYALFALAAAASASVLELSVGVKHSYSSVELQIGTPAKPYRFMFDTGSSTSWVTGRNCTATTCVNGGGFARTPYDERNSSTSFAFQDYVSIPYIDGDVLSGHVFRDNFYDEKGTVEWNQTFLAAADSSWNFVTADGFFGLAFSSIASRHTQTIVETMLWENKLDAPRFAVFYGTNLNDTGVENNGVLTIGASHEEEYVDGEISWVPLRKEDPYQVWRAPLRSVNVLVASGVNSTISVHNGQAPTTSDPVGTYPINTTWPLYGEGTAVFDTGAGRISVPENIFEPLYFNLGWNATKLLKGEERMGCQHMNSSWAISFTFGEDADESMDKTFTIRGDEFLRAGDKDCMPPVDNSGSASFALLGAVFLRRHYSIFDFGANQVKDYKPRVGFGRLKKEQDYFYQDQVVKVPVY